jgi:tetratricopeptide (TPR) repeat protein
LANLLERRSDVDGAIAIFRDLLAQTERQEGPEGSTAITYCQRLAPLLEATRCFDQAILLRDRVLASKTKEYEQLRDSPSDKDRSRAPYVAGVVMHALDDVAHTAAELGDLDRAEACNGEAISMSENIGQPNPERRAVFLKTRAIILRKRGRTKEAAATIRSALDLLEQKDKWSLDRHRSGLFDRQPTRPYVCVLYDELNALLSE